MNYDFFINCRPVPQARPRFFLKHSNGRRWVGSYDPKHCANFKKLITSAVKSAIINNKYPLPSPLPLSLSIKFYMGINSKYEHHTQKPDIDNLAKAVLDSLNGIIYYDDKQITTLHLYKFWGDPGLSINVKLL